MHPVTRRRMRNHAGRGVSFGKVWAMLEREAEERKKEAAERQAAWEAERKKEAAERLAAWEAKRQKEAAEWQAKWEQEKKEYDRLNNSYERMLDELKKQVGGLNNSFGELAEHLVAPGIVDKFNEMGFHIKQAATHGMKILGENRKVRAEIDLYMENGETIIAVEVKAKPVIQDIKEHIERLEVIRDHRNSLNDKRKILGAIAGAIFEDKVKKAVRDAGFFVIVQSGDTMKIEIPEDFVPREW
ncbi:MAG: YraN family protein [Treponema sp.]|jgi:hypothetical protein|nr:YraN family protein [Treponema sp.]